MIGTHSENHDCDLCNWARKTEHEQAKSLTNGHILYTEQNCSVFHDSDKQCPVHEGGLAVCRLCNEYEDGLDEPCRKAQPEQITIPTFTSDWDRAPRAKRARVEMEDAAYWYAMGQRAKDIELKLAWNQELRALACVQREKVER